MSVRPHGTTRLPLDRFSWNIVCYYFSKTSQDNSSFIKIWQKYGYFTWRPDHVHLWRCLALFVFGMRSVSEKNRENKTHFVFNNLLPKNPAGFEKMWKKYGRTGRVTNGSIIRRMCYACWITKTRIDTHTHTHTLIIFNSYCSSTTIVTRTRPTVTL